MKPIRSSKALDRLLTGIRRAKWFTALGKPLTPAQRRDARAWLAGIGYRDIPLEAAPNWRAAKRIASDPGWDGDWWRAEETQRLALLRAAERLGTPGAMELMTEAGMAAHDKALKAARRHIPDASFALAAAGAAAQGCYLGALALLAGDPDHAFSARLGLFLGGRWPLGILGGKAYIF